MQLHPRTNVVDGAMPLIRFERELTVGGIGTIWLGRLAVGTEAGRTVLLRRMPKALFSAKDIEALKKVAGAYSKVRHPSLVKLLGVVEQDNDIISVSEHLDGVRWCDLMRCSIDGDSPLPATVAVRIVLDAARATLKAHRLAAESGLFPAERLLVSEGIFIAAFGGTLLTETGVLSAIARCAQPRSIPDLVAQLAPEELESSTPSKGSPEVFSLGVLLWEALTNRYLFSRDSARQTLEDLRARPITPLDQIERCGMPVPDALAEVVRIATSRHPNQRFADVSEFVSALEELPPHFLATEHQVANALRDQAADLLREFHVDPSQLSLTLAFSEVPASKFSTRPPPDNGHNWEPPTFAQRRLVTALQLPAASITAMGVSEPSPDFAHESSRVPAASPRARSRKYLVGLVLALVTIAVAPVLARVIRPKAQPAILSVAPSQFAPAALASSLEADKPMSSPNLEAETPAGVSVPPAAPLPPLAAGQRGSRPRKTALDSPAASAVPESTPPPASRKLDPTYRPRQIAPYRPKGI